MINHIKRLWQRLSAPDINDNAEVERIAHLQKSAAKRRAEHAEKEQAALTSDELLQDAVSSSRKRVEEAEAAHLSALQKWENGQSRQKSR